MDASLILEKLFSRSGFYDIVCFSIFASRPHLEDAKVLMLLYLTVDQLLMFLLF